MKILHILFFFFAIFAVAFAGVHEKIDEPAKDDGPSAAPGGEEAKAAPEPIVHDQ